jgi:hypothetical protein
MNTQFKSGAITMLTAVLVSMFTVSVHAQTVLRVDIENVDVNGDGTGWGPDAFKFLQDALDEAADLAQFGLVDLWVAASQTPYVAEFDPFYIPNNVRVFGGFNGDEEEFAERPLDPTTTTLTGSFEIVSFIETNQSARIDGFTLDGAVWPISLYDSSAIVSNCVIRGGLSLPRMDGRGVPIDQATWCSCSKVAGLRYPSVECRR